MKKLKNSYIAWVVCLLS